PAAIRSRCLKPRVTPTNATCSERAGANRYAASDGLLRQAPDGAQTHLSRQGASRHDFCTLAPLPAGPMREVDVNAMIIRGSLSTPIWHARIGSCRWLSLETTAPSVKCSSPFRPLRRAIAPAAPDVVAYVGDTLENGLRHCWCGHRQASAKLERLAQA